MALVSNWSATESYAQSDGTLLYQISGNGLTQPSYVYGTIHIICETDFFVSESAIKALSQSKKMYLEIDLSDENMGQKMQAAMIHPELMNIGNALTQEEYQMVDEYFVAKLGVGLKQLGFMKPFALSSLLTLELLECEGQMSYEEHFLTLAQKNNITIAGLESAEYQLSLFDSIPYEEQVSDLLKMIREPEEGMEEFEKMMHFYKSQDANALYNEVILKNEQFTKNKELLIDNRNRNWIPIIIASITNESTFVAVGAGHLAGDNGVLELLRKQGYTVTPIK